MTKTTNLQVLLGATTEITKVVPLKRLGISFKVKALSNAEIERVRMENTFSDGKGGKKVDETKLGAALIAKACVDPLFSDRTLIDHYNAEDAADCVLKALLPGELQKVNAAVMEASGFGDDEIDFPN
jgi:hypothetical protein